MPIHDWTRVDAGIFHHFHHGWIEEIARALNRGILPGDYYAMAEQHAAGFGPDVLTLQSFGSSRNDNLDAPSPHGTVTLLAAPKLRPVAETDLAFYRRKQKVIAVRHVSDDKLVAIVEIVSRGNKAGRNPMQAFVEKAAVLLEHRIHLLIIDLFPPGKRDPTGIHGVIWRELTDDDYSLPTDRQLTLAAYESTESVRAYVQHVAVGDPLPDMPLFLEWERAVDVPLEATYRAAFAEVPRRWRHVLDPTES